MAESTSLPIPRTTSPLYGAQAGELAGQLATLSTEELAKILRVNHRIAATNRLRYSRFHDDAERALPALAAYTGIVSNGSLRRISRPGISNMRRRTSTSPRSFTDCSARWTRSAPTGSKATPYCPATASRRFSNIGRTN